VTTLRYLPGVRDQLRLLSPQARRRLKQAAEALARGDKGPDVRRLRGEFVRPLHRLKVGSWRLVFYRDGTVLYVIRVFPRTLGYDWLESWALSPQTEGGD
jgi:mRNA-degrading endonuclease RelE of RelBE toxin-antitoxin system